MWAAQEVGNEILEDSCYKEFARYTDFTADHLSGVFCCGAVEDATIFVARQSGGKSNRIPRDAYVVLKCR